MAQAAPDGKGNRKRTHRVDGQTRSSRGPEPGVRPEGNLRRGSGRTRRQSGAVLLMPCVDAAAPVVLAVPHNPKMPQPTSIASGGQDIGRATLSDRCAANGLKDGR